MRPPDRDRRLPDLPQHHRQLRAFRPAVNGARRAGRHDRGRHARPQPHPADLLQGRQGLVLSRNLREPHPPERPERRPAPARHAADPDRRTGRPPHAETPVERPVRRVRDRQPAGSPRPRRPGHRRPRARRRNPGDGMGARPRPPRQRHHAEGHRPVGPDRPGLVPHQPARRQRGLRQGCALRRQDRARPGRPRLPRLRPGTSRFARAVRAVSGTVADRRRLRLHAGGDIQGRRPRTPPPALDHQPERPGVGNHHLPPYRPADPGRRPLRNRRRRSPPPSTPWARC